MKHGGRSAILTVTVVSMMWAGVGCADPSVRPVGSVRVAAPDSGSQSRIGVRMLSDGPDASEVASIRSAADARAAVAARAERQNAPASRREQPAEAAPPESLAAEMARSPVPAMGMVGLVPNAKRLAAYILATYPGVQSIGGVRSDPIPDHPSGHAIDIMIGGDMGLGDVINADVQRQSRRFGVAYTLWRVADHFNHVHVTVS